MFRSVVCCLVLLTPRGCLGSTVVCCLVLLAPRGCLGSTADGFGDKWDYEGDIGPSHWQKTYPYCGGDRQSPISIDTSIVKYDGNMGSFMLEGYDRLLGINMSMVNNGHSVQINLQGLTPTVTGGGLPGEYRATQFHFHWGSDNRRGSEHDIDTNHFPMEMHIVHYWKKYPNVSEANNKKDGLMVFAFFIKEGRHNQFFEDLVKHFDRVGHNGDSFDLPAIPLRHLMGNNLQVYYRYEGSLTTPPCYESVIWTVFREPIEISETQMNRFRNQIKKNNANKPDRDVSDDFRPVQLLNLRVVYSSHPDGLAPYSTDNDTNGAPTQPPACRLLSLVGIAVLLLF